MISYQTVIFWWDDLDISSNMLSELVKSILHQTSRKAFGNFKATFFFILIRNELYYDESLIFYKTSIISIVDRGRRIPEKSFVLFISFVRIRNFVLARDNFKDIFDWGSLADSLRRTQDFEWILLDFLQTCFWKILGNYFLALTFLYIWKGWYVFHKCRIYLLFWLILNFYHWRIFRFDQFLIWNSWHYECIV